MRIRNLWFTQENVSACKVEEGRTSSGVGAVGQGRAAVPLGRLADACGAFDEALTHEPALVDAWYNRSDVKTYSSGDPDIGAMERLLGRCSYQERLLLHFALDKAHMDTGETVQAFAH